MPRKRRTRAHIIADLAVNHVERQVLLAGYSVERVWSDYGTDLLMFTYTSDGEAENGLVFLQVRSTDHLRLVATDEAIAIRVDVAHLDQWMSERYPFVLVMYDVGRDVAYWLHVQGSLPLDGSSRRTTTLHVPRANPFTPVAVRHLGDLKNSIVHPERRGSLDEAE